MYLANETYFLFQHCFICMTAVCKVTQGVTDGCTSRQLKRKVK
jgi:hypothetical protein